MAITTSAVTDTDVQISVRYVDLESFRYMPRSSREGSYVAFFSSGSGNGRIAQGLFTFEI